jgi:hypothetical protein
MDELVKKNIKEGILSFEQELRQQENVFLGDSDNCPLKHSFSEGMYVREIFIPKGTYLVGKIHKHSHPNFLLKGEVLVITEGEGREYLRAPLSMISPPGTKRALYAITDLVWVTVHENRTNTQDLSELEKEIIASTYEEYERFIEGKTSRVKRIVNYIKALLS